MHDALSTVLEHADIEAAFFSRAQGASPWGVFTRGSVSGIFHVVVRGSATLRVGDMVHSLTAGEIAVIPLGLAHTLCDPPGAPAVWIGELPAVDDGLPTVLAGTGTPTTEILCGTVRMGELGRELVLPHLPPVLVARGPALSSWVRALATELHVRPPGADAVSACLGRLLFLLALREWIANKSEPSWLTGLAHPELGRVLATVQAAPEQDWSVERLARRSGLSRSVFCKRFLATMGEPPGAWVTRWRMVVARQMLARSERSLGEVAAAVGYASEAAFQRAFRRQIGVPPARWRRGGVARAVLGVAGDDVDPERGGD